MRNRGSAAALIGALVLVCAVVALEWYSHVGRGNSGAPPPVQAVTPAPSVSPAATATAKPTPVVYFPVQPTSAPIHGKGSTTVGSTAPPLNAGPAPRPQEPLATLAPTKIMPPVVREAPDAPPRILAMTLSTPVAHSGEVILGVVETSSNVASVEARIGGYGALMRKVGVGRFRLEYRVPPLPFFLHRTYRVEIIARNTRGDAVTSSLPITVR